MKIRPQLLELEPYEGVSGEEGVIKLDGNENPYGPSPKVREALANYKHFNLYPHPQQERVRKMLADYVGVGDEHIVAGNGSDELIDLVLRLFLNPNDKVIVLPPTFGMYRFSTIIYNGQVLSIPRKKDFSLNMPEIVEAATKAKLIFIASPNNPTGNLTPLEQVEELLKTGIIVVVDEAYYEFCGVTALPLLPQYENLIILRSLSKWAGLAGLRAGYGIFPKKVAQLLLKIKPPYNLSRAAEEAIVASLQDSDFLKEKVKLILQERERMFGELSNLGFVKVYPSQANFLLCHFLQGDTFLVYKELRRRGILVRYFPDLKEFLRISVGRPQDTDALISALKEIKDEPVS